MDYRTFLIAVAVYSTAYRLPFSEFCLDSLCQYGPYRPAIATIELAGAFGDLGTLIPFLVAYINLLGLVPAEHRARIVEASISWNYTTVLNIGFLALAALMVWRFMRTGGPAMLRMMNSGAT